MDIQKEQKKKKKHLQNKLKYVFHPMAGLILQLHPTTSKRLFLSDTIEEEEYSCLKIDSLKFVPNPSPLSQTRPPGTMLGEHTQRLFWRLFWIHQDF